MCQVLFYTLETVQNKTDWGFILPPIPPPCDAYTETKVPSNFLTA